MGFLEHFQEYNQTLENIFLSRKYFTGTKHSLKDYHALKIFFNPTSICSKKKKKKKKNPTSIFVFGWV